MGKNKKKALKEQIEITKEQIRSNSKDVAFANKLIGNLLSLKGQFDLDPSILHVSTKEVIKSFDFETFVIHVCQTSAIIQYKGGYVVVVDMRMRALFEFIVQLCALKNKYNTLTEDERKGYNGSLFGITLLMQIPLFATVDDEFFFKIVKYVGDELGEMFERYSNMPLEPEQPSTNNVEGILEVLKSLKDDEPVSDDEAQLPDPMELLHEELNLQISGETENIEAVNELIKDGKENN